MPHNDHVITPPANQTLTQEALDGLLRNKKTLSPKFFYDEEGCRLFQKITELPEYYLTRTELLLLETVAPAVAAGSASRTALVEYGASDESKARFLLDQCQTDADPVFDAYLAIDVASEGLDQTRDRLERLYPHLDVHVLAADFFRPIDLPHAFIDKPRLGFFPGSTIGNFDPSTASTLLRQIGKTLGRGAQLLVGVDLRKDPQVLLSAYNDSAGVTAAFNRNALVRLNREADAGFDIDAFVHRAIWNDEESRIEMHLISLRDQVANIADQKIRFTEGETIHTENSYKHTVDGFAALAKRSGWRAREVWTDAENLFSMHLLETE